MLIATSPRLSSDQEKSKSTEEAYPVEVIRVSSKYNSGISGGKAGDTETCEDHSSHTPTSQSAYEYMFDCTASKQLNELYDGQQMEKAECPVYHDSVNPITTQSDTHHHITQLKDTQDTQFLYYVQHTEAPSEEPDNSLQTAVLTDEFCKFLQIATVQSEESTSKNLTFQSEELPSLGQTSSVQSELGSLLQNSATTPEHNTDTLQISIKSDRISESFKTATPQSEDLIESIISESYKSEEPFKSLQTVAVKSEEPFKSLQTADVQSEGAFNSMQIPPVLSEKPCDRLQTETAYSEGPYNSLWTATDQSEEFNRLLQKSADLSEGLSDFPKTASLQSLDFSNLKEVKTFQQEPYDLQQSAYVRLDHPDNTGQGVSNNSEVLSLPSQEATVPAEFYRTLETTEEQVDITFNSGKRHLANYAEPCNIKKTATVESEELYLPGTHDGYWSDSVTAYKVAVEGDLNG